MAGIVGGAGAGLAAALEIEPVGYFAHQADEGRIHIEQPGLEADQVVVEVFGGHPYGKHFHGIQAFVAQVAAAHFAHGGLGLPLDGAQEAQPGGKRDGSEPCAVVAAAKQQREHVAQVVAVFIGGIEALVEAVAEFVAEAGAGEDADGDQGGVHAHAGEPAAQQGGDGFAFAAFLPQMVAQDAEAHLRACRAALPQPSHHCL
ncbi:hypothetical protein EIKCOROL_01642 [Eikenella corrodens ATCC 23834]|uniref:Uncharacterized protein n=1 Tax=Eikenella corrodens ATCC 23834 TaxID=546274 RepID=C0DW92_EIKCO|nr:hypothetical protein EIKCOROL_01642 [Eikenella corrodens ATCC 23834]